VIEEYPICASYCVGNQVPGEGPLDAEIVFVGEAPGATEAKLGRPFTGQSGQLLDSALAEIGIDRSQCYVTNAVRCRPPNNATPSGAELESCNPRLMGELSRLARKRVVVPLGGSGYRSVTGSLDPISKVRGWARWNTRLQAHVLPTWHPAYILRTPAAFDDFFADLKKIKRVLELPPGEAAAPETQYMLVTVREQLPWLYEMMLRNWAKEQALMDVPFRPGEIEERIRDLGHDDSYPRLPVAVDLETDGLQAFLDRVLLIAISFKEGTAAIITPEVFRDEQARPLLQHMLLDPRFEWITHNGKFDRRFVAAQMGMELRLDFDTMLAHYAVDERHDSHGLKVLAREYFDAPDYAAELKPFLPSSATPYSRVPRDILARYAAMDVDYTRKLYYELKPQLASEGVEKAFYDLLTPAQVALSDVEQHGMLVDREYLERLKVEYAPTLAAKQRELDEIARSVGFSYEAFMTAELNSKRRRMEQMEEEWVEPLYNPNAPKQTQHIVYDLLRMPKWMGERTTNAEAMVAYRGRHPFIAKLLDYREDSKLWGTYIVGMESRLGPDGRIHTDYLLHGTVTGRLSSANPNMQNIPRESPIKRMFVASPGYTFVEADYSALELRVAAWYSQDEKMLDYFRQGIDFHRRVGSAVFNKPEELVTEHERFLTKFITFGLLYGRGAQSLAQGELGGTTAAAEKYIQRFFEEFPQLAAWVAKVQHQAVTDGYITTPFGRKRRWNFITHDIEWKIKKQAVNSPIQSAASDLCLSALIRLNTRLRAEGLGYVLGTVHDSIMYEVPTDRETEAVMVIREEMEMSPFPVPFTPFWPVDIKTGASWGEATKWK